MSSILVRCRFPIGHRANFELADTMHLGGDSSVHIQITLVASHLPAKGKVRCPEVR